MITIQKQVNLPDTYPLERLGPLDKILFFDIETTGFSGDSTTLYLIGCTYFKDGSWNLIQWFADTLDSEEQLLHEFFHFLKPYRYLVHFNGDGFDIPYLLKRCRHLKLDYDFSGITSIDIYRRIRPYKKLLGLDSLKQKAIEGFLGVARKDLFSGGELIEVYQNYLHSRDQALYGLLMLHNEDDLKGMPSILPILSYSDFFVSSFRLVQIRITRQQNLFEDCDSQLELLCESPVPIPVPFDRYAPMAACLAEENHLLIALPFYEGELKYFYPDYKNYYYLVYEDTSIHKSIGEFVDRDARVKATAKTCYTRKESRFIPQFAPLWSPEFRQDYTAKQHFVEYHESLLHNECDFQAYLKQIFDYLLA